MTSLLRLLSFNASIDPERYPPTLDPDSYDPIIRRETITSFLVAAGVDLDLICLQGFVPGDFKGLLRLLPSFHGFISFKTGCAILARKAVFDSLHFKDRNGSVQLEALPAGTEEQIQVWSIDSPEEPPQFDPRPQIVAGTIELETQGFINALRKVGNFEPTRPFEQGPLVTDHLFVRKATPVSGDVDDRVSARHSNGHLWSLKSEGRRIEAVLSNYGSDHLPIRATIRV